MNRSSLLSALALSVALWSPRLEAQNLLQNPDFSQAAQLSGWGLNGGSYPTWSSMDRLGSPTSGSARVGSHSFSSSMPDSSQLSQSVLVNQGSSYDVGSWISVSDGCNAANNGTGRLDLIVYWFSDSACTSAPFSNVTIPTPSPGNTWTKYNLTLQAPAGTLCSRLVVHTSCSISTIGGDASYIAYVDDALFSFVGVPVQLQSFEIE